MAYELKNVFTSDGTEISGASLSGANKMAYDGRYLWITCGTNGIAIYDHWYDDIDRNPERPEFTELNELTYPYWRELDIQLKNTPQNKIKLVTFIKITGSQIVRSTCLPSLAEPGATKTSRAGTDATTSETIEGDSRTFRYKANNYGDDVYSKTTSRSGNALNAYWIKQIGDKMYVTNGVDFNEIFEFNVQTQNLVRTFNVYDTYTGEATVPYADGMPSFTPGTNYTMLSNLEVGAGKLWMIGRSWGETQRRQLYSYEPITGTKTNTPIQAAPSYARSYIAHCNGFIYSTNYNGFGVSKFNAETGAFVGNIRVNGFPQGIWAGPDRKIWVTSFGGMLSLIDYDDDQVHNDFSTESTALNVQVDPTDSAHIWYVRSGKLVHYNLNTKTQYENGTTADWEFKNLQYPQGFGYKDPEAFGTPSEFIVIPEFTYLDENLDEKTVKPHMLALMSNKLFAWFVGFDGSPDENDPEADVTYFDYKYPFEFAARPEDKYPYRVIYAELNGQAAVVSAGSSYFGD